MRKGILWLLFLIGLSCLWRHSHSLLLHEHDDYESSNKLIVYGLLRSGSSKTFSFDDLRNMNMASFVTSDALSMKKTGQGRHFQGIRLGDLIQEAQPANISQMITLVGADEYRATVLNADVWNYPIYICFLEDGKPISSDKGPFRVIVDSASATSLERKRLDVMGVWSLRKIFIGLQPSANRKELTLWTPIPPLITDQIKVEFEKSHPEINLKVLTIPSGNLHRWVSEYLASTSLIGSFPDLIWFSEPSDSERLKMTGHLTPYFPQKAESIPLLFRDPDGYYTGVRLLRVGFVCNTNFPIPNDLTDLLKEEYRDRIAWVRPGQIGTYILAILVGNEDLGWNFVRQILQNTSRENIFASFGDSCDCVVAGKAAVGVSLDYLVFNLLRANPDLPIRFVQPASFPVFMASPIAILHGTRMEDEAKMFIDDLLSDKIQALLIKNGFSSTRSDLPLPGANGSATSPIASSPPTPIDHRYVAVNAPVLLRCYEELESQIYGD